MDLTMILVLGGVAVAAGVVLTWAGWRTVREEPYRFCRCPGCGQKVRYRASKAGRGGMCPRCGQRWTLPASPRDLADGGFNADGYPVRVGERLQRTPRLTASRQPNRGANS
jgi:hypothetical protein